MRPCEHETRFNDEKLPGKKRLCGRPAGVFETVNSLATIQVALCAGHLHTETSKGREFRTVEHAPTSKEIREMRERERIAASRAAFEGKQR